MAKRHKRYSPRHRGVHGAKRVPQPRVFRVERLEDRVMLATFDWKVNADSKWGTGANWTVGGNPSAVAPGQDRWRR